MSEKLQQHLLVGQAAIWAGLMIGLAIVNVILDNIEGRFTFGSVSIFGLITVLFFTGLAQTHLRFILSRAQAGEPMTNDQ